MSHRQISRLLAGFVFLYAFVLYLMTIAPTASFWDASERIAVSHGLQVPHPPGAPFYMLIGRLFSMFVPAGYVAVSINIISALAGALTVMLTFLIVLRLAQEWRGHPSTWTPFERFSAFAGGVIGALTLAATHSFWFDAVEAETYAFSTFLTALGVWLVLRWSEIVRVEGAQLAAGIHTSASSTSGRWLLLIMYVYGLAIGVHLLSLLSLFFVAFIIFFTNFERPEWTTGRRWGRIALAGVITTLLFAAIYPGIIQWMPALLAGTGAAGLSLSLIILLLIVGLYYTQKKRMQLANFALLCVTMLLIGYSTYALIVIRSQAEPPINQNDPSSVEALISYLKREQYGQTPLLRGSTYDDRLGRVNFEREVIFPRRHSPMQQHWSVYAMYDSDMEFFLRYQIGHMYMRYLMWNFVGRASDQQDAGWYTGISTRETEQYLYQTPSQRAARTTYYGLPLLLGLFGMMFHFWRDWRRAFSVGVLFFVTSIAIILYLNQTPMQPRERDYSYIASFFAFSIWVGIGAAGMLELLGDALRSGVRSRPLQWAAMGLVGAVLFVASPLQLATQNYFINDRSGNYVPPDFAYNMLMSVEPNAILFTGGDNDTFPLWYLQEVEGIRRDVRVANLSLMNTQWNILQLKNQWSRESAPIPMTYTDDQVHRLTVVPWRPREITLEVDPQLVRQHFGESYRTVLDTLGIDSPLRWSLGGRPYTQDLNILYVADQAVLNILMENARLGWQRPIYFAITVGPDNMLDLSPYLQLEGLTYRVVPAHHGQDTGIVIPDIMNERLAQFRFRNLNNPDVYFDETSRSLLNNYRNIYIEAAQALVQHDRDAEARRILDAFNTQVPFDIIPGNFYTVLMMSRVYDEAGDPDRSVALLSYAEPIVLNTLSTASTAQQVNQAVRFTQMIQFAYVEKGEYDQAAAFSARIADVLGDESYRQSPDQLRQMYSPPPAPPDAG